MNWRRDGGEHLALWGVALGWALGGTLAGVAGVFATPVFGWTSLYWIGSLSFLLLPFMHFMLPESPKFLALQGRTEIRDMLSKLRPERAAVYKSAEIAVEQSEKPVNSVAVLLHPKYRRTTFAIWASAFLSLFCIFGLSGWIPTVMMQRGERFAAKLRLRRADADHVVRRRSRAWASRRQVRQQPRADRTWWAIGGVAVLSLVVLNDHIVNITSVAAAGFFIIGAQFVLNNFTAASYETGVRATAVLEWNSGSRGSAPFSDRSSPARCSNIPEPDADVPVDRHLGDRRRGDHPAGAAAGGRPCKQP